jgi:hypothetical protein
MVFLDFETSTAAAERGFKKTGGLLLLICQCKLFFKKISCKKTMCHEVKPNVLKKTGALLLLICQCKLFFKKYCVKKTMCHEVKPNVLVPVMYSYHGKLKIIIIKSSRLCPEISISYCTLKSFMNSICVPKLSCTAQLRHRHT